MAQLLFDRDSTDKHLNATRRHLRSTRKIKGGDKLAGNIQPLYDQLIQKQADRLDKETARQDANDDLLLADTNLDNAVRNTFEGCNQHDRANPTDQVLKKVFPDGTFGDIVRLPIKDEPDEVEAIARRLESLGESHPLYAQAAVLRQRVTASHAAIDTLKTAIKDEKKAEADEEIAQAELRRQYENNYLDARKEFGRSVAEQLFPKLSGSSSRTVDVGQESFTE